MSLPDLVYRFKTLTTNRYIHGVRKSGWTPFSGRLWQRNYYEHIIRDQAEFNRIRDYVANNPLQWKNDRENPSRSMSAGADIKSVREKEPWKA
jgi:putative transposase